MDGEHSKPHSEGGSNAVCTARKHRMTFFNVQEIEQRARAHFEASVFSAIR